MKNVRGPECNKRNNNETKALVEWMALTGADVDRVLFFNSMPVVIWHERTGRSIDFQVHGGSSGFSPFRRPDTVAE